MFNSYSFIHSHVQKKFEYDYLKIVFNPPPSSPQQDWFKIGFCLQPSQLYSHRRMSDPSSSWNYFTRGSFKKSGVRKARSDAAGIDFDGSSGCAEVVAGNIQDGNKVICYLIKGIKQCCWCVLFMRVYSRLIDAVFAWLQPSGRCCVCMNAAIWKMLCLRNDSSLIDAMCWFCYRVWRKFGTRLPR